MASNIQPSIAAKRARRCTGVKLRIQLMAREDTVTMRTMRRPALTTLVLVLSACGDGGGASGPTRAGLDFPAPSTVAEFSVVPVNMPAAGTLTPLGHIQPVG